MSDKVHAAAFGGYDQNAAIVGSMIERDVPLCGCWAIDPRLTYRDERITCSNCKRMLSIREGDDR